MEQQVPNQPDAEKHKAPAANEPVGMRRFVPQPSESAQKAAKEVRYGRRAGEVDFVMVDRPFSLRGRFRSFRYAVRGVGIMLKSQHNAWLHLLGTILVCALGLFFRLSSGEWCWLIATIMVVWTAEALNTAFEFLCDVASPEYHPLVTKAKDTAAGAVLICAIGSTVVGLLIFGPHIMEFVWGL